MNHFFWIFVLVALSAFSLGRILGAVCRCPRWLAEL